MGCRLSTPRVIEMCFTLFTRIFGWFLGKLNFEKRKFVTDSDRSEQVDRVLQRASSTEVLSFEAELERRLLELQDSRQTSSSGTSKRDEAEDAKSLKDFEDSLKPTEEELEKNEEWKKRESELKKELEIVMARMKDLQKESKSISDIESEVQRKEAEEEFERELAEQKKVFDRKMKELREKRAQIEKDAEEELEKIRKESTERITMFLKYIQLKLRFEEKEDEWRQMLDGLRRPVASACSSYYNLQSELREIRKEELHDFDKESMEIAGKSFGRKLAVAQELLNRAFRHMETLAEEHGDRVFIKIIMESLSDLGYQCNFAGQQLVEVMRDLLQVELTRRLDYEVSKISPHSIPTTSKLKELSKSPEEEMFADNKEPPYPDWFVFFQ